MDVSTDNQKNTAQALHDAFVGKRRNDGATYYCLRDGSPEWMRDAIHAAHKAVDEGVQDAVYETVMDAAEYLASCNRWEDGAHEFADTAVSVYNDERVNWLAAHAIARGSLVDEACEELGTAPDASLFDRIAVGWYEWARRIYEAVREACEEQAEEDDQ